MFKYACVLCVFLHVNIASGQISENTLPGCSKNEFECRDGRCIPLHDKCDSFPDCNDASDEDMLVCINQKCPPKISFQCANGACIEAERQCDGYQNCLDASDEDLELCNYTSSVGRCPTYEFQCKRGGCIERKYECDGTEHCADGSDEEPIACKNRFSKDRCAVPKTETNAKCDVVNCTTGMYISSCDLFLYSLNTCIELKCEEGNVLEDYRERFLSQCRKNINSDLVWEPPLTKCQECGNDERLVPLIAWTYNVTRPVPWNVALYRNLGDKDCFYCGGTLVHLRAVITAAHCVKKFDALGNPENRFPLDQLRVAMGKMFQDYNANETFAQKFKVLDVRIHYYNPSFENDIAILILDGKVKPNPDVMPVCLDRNVNNYDDYKFKPGPTIFGKVPGYGRTELGKNSDVLKEASFQVCCDYIDCKPKVGQTARLSLSPDKFCVQKLSEKSASVEKGDSGGGFVVKRSNGHSYLYGVVSAKWETDNMRLFTIVPFHAPWLYRRLEVNETLDRQSFS